MHLPVPRRLAACLGLLLSLGTSLQAQSGLEDDRVLLQGFYWESYRHGHPERFPELGTRKWYEIVRDQAPAIGEGRLDLIWLPPPSFSGELSAGYNPKEYFNLANSYGTFEQHRAALVALLENGVEPVADLVLNHRDGTRGWADFTNPDWGTDAITRHDEAFLNPASEVFETPVEERGAEEESPVEYDAHGGTTYGYPSFRDIDHTSERVRRDVIRYLLQLQSLGYRGFRYDMVHGFHARWIALYNRASRPTFSVGEYDWGRHAAQRGWIWHSATSPGELGTSSSVFDFTTYFTLVSSKGNYLALYGYGNGIGMVGDTTDGLAWKNRAVTFLENHDTGYRTHEDGSPEEGHRFDSFLNDWQVEQGYAYILTHPGVPSVFWKHYFDWGPELRDKIRALVNARKVAGVHAGSVLHVQHNAQERGVYAARVEGRNGDLYLRVGGSDAEWEPSHSRYEGFREYAAGSGWKVWVGLPGNPQPQQAPRRAPLPVPEYRDPAEIEIPEEWLR